MSELYVRNRQRSLQLNLRFFRRLTLALLEEILDLPSFELGVFFTGKSEMARINSEYLNHSGPTDVITFDYGAPGGGPALWGEIFICTDVAVEQATRYRTMWQQELVRYLVHGVLHLQGYDDAETAQRKLMKKQEDSLFQLLKRRFPLRDLERKPTLRT